MELVIDLTKKTSGYREAAMRYFASKAGRAYCEYGIPNLDNLSPEEAIQRLHVVDDTRICAHIHSVRWEDTRLVLKLIPIGPFGGLLGDTQYAPAARIIKAITPGHPERDYVTIIGGFDLIPAANHIDYQE